LVSRAREQITAAAERLIDTSGDAVTFRRGDAEVLITALPVDPEYDLLTGEGIRVRGERKDFLVMSGDLILDEEIVTPARGDLLVDTLNGSEVTYECVDDDSEGPFIYEDPGRTVLRIHTRKINTEGES
jgi:hypothetical protein